MREAKYEIEVKSLLGEADAAEKLRAGLKRIDPSCTLVSSYTQLNHYFEGGDAKTLVERLSPHVASGVAERMRRIVDGEKISVRTREMNGVAKIVMKASLGSDSSDNGVVRMEVEEPVAGMSLDALDKEVLAVGYRYQAKWSRTREEYTTNDIAVCLDKNAGYGYLAEFEKVVHDSTGAEAARSDIDGLMQALGAVELPQDRLERMFAYYNKHWPEYYGTEKVFSVQ